MPNKNCARTARTSTTRPEPALRVVPDPAATVTRTATEDKLWAVLHTNPGTTAVELSTSAGIGKSTAQKILARWAHEGSVTRTASAAGGSGRAADLWTITETSTAEPTTTDSDAGDGPDAVDPVGDGEVHPVPTAGNDDEHLETDTPSDVPQENSAPEDARSEADTAHVAVPDETPNTEPPHSTESGPIPTLAEAIKARVGRAARLAPGALRGQVEDYLRDHPAQRFSPTEIARALEGRSGGAVSNALDKLVADGVAVRVQDKPRRFALAPVEQPVTATLES
ncbi:winged helix-turn-helix domain-containing protein [Actinokineospora globicatena]|uniref:winged helix-turn-helix domain-containing protein n=1 Tax=Actinokineospora globicatena TaxID=103729 RepID=UPI0020A3138C|nr:winged helix-turn-helix domain-containing protein [Actinokineospora globicatena]MCP2304067.1 hypothetical protein [Actinokineospora globicatena]GLW78582.1 hypothetical protein Aglo01_30640 [Actinokineospora globicatena]GLW84751.1 hypothetical protein Aglo02_23910 [Actinokineospora globicatena]